MRKRQTETEIRVELKCQFLKSELFSDEVGDGCLTYSGNLQSSIAAMSRPR